MHSLSKHPSTLDTLSRLPFPKHFKMMVNHTTSYVSLQLQWGNHWKSDLYLNLSTKCLLIIYFLLSLLMFKKVFTSLKKCITLKHTCANNFLYIFFIIVYFHFILMFSREKSLQISLLAVSWLWRRHHHLL